MGSKFAAASGYAELYVEIVTTGMTLTDGTGARELEEPGEFEQAFEREKTEELRTILSERKIDSFYDGLHALNPVDYRFQTGSPGARRH